MRGIRWVLLLGLFALAAVAGTASAAPGGGALVLAAPCTLSLPGGLTATGTGQQVVLPNGAEVVRCSAQLAPGSPLPTRAVTISFGSCITVVTPTGHVVGHCRPS